jgi:hypothetical protein
MFKKTVAAAALFGGLLLSTASQAALIAQWDMTGQLGTQVTQATSSAAAGISGGLLSRGAGIVATAAANSFNSNAWNAQATDYVSFVFTIANGLSLALDNFTVGTQSSATGPGTIGLYYSGDNFATALATVAQPSAALSNNIFTLASLPVLAAGTVEFRFAQIGTLAPNGAATAAGGTFRVSDYALGGDQNVTFNGTLSSTVPAAVPLPPAIALLGAGLSALGFVGRRRKGAALAA